MNQERRQIGYRYSDGGRLAAGYRGSTGDCGVRAAAIVLARPYKQVYQGFYALAGKSPRLGVSREVLTAYLRDAGWAWWPVMRIGSGCILHLSDAQQMPGRIICRLSHHYVAIVDHVIYDTVEPSPDRCVYGYWAGDNPLVAQ